MTDAPKLKPCPFCGNADELLYGFGGRIFCDECGCEGPFSHFFKGDWNTRADLIDMDVLARVEAIIDKMAAAWFIAVQNNKGQHMTLGEIGALAKHHLDVTALKASEDTLADLRVMTEKINE